MNKIFGILFFVVIVFVSYKAYHVEGSCLSLLSNNIKKCEPHECYLNKKTHVKDKAKIVGFNKNGKCVYHVNTGRIQVKCKFPKRMLSYLSKEFAQKDRAERYGPITKSRVGWKEGVKKGTRMKTAEVLIKGRWEEYLHILQDAFDDDICVAYNTKTRKFINNKKH